MLTYFMCFAIATGLDFFQMITEKQEKRMLIIYTILVVIAFAMLVYYFLNPNDRSISSLLTKFIEERK